MEEESLKRERLQADIHSIKNTLTSFGLKLELVYGALTGNEISKDGGLVAEIQEQRDQIHDLTKRVETVEALERKRMMYINIIYAAMGVIITTIFDYFFKKH